MLLVETTPRPSAKEQRSLETLKIVADLSRGLGKFDDVERSCLDDPPRVVSSETGAMNVAPDAVTRIQNLITLYVFAIHKSSAIIISISLAFLEQADGTSLSTRETTKNT